MGIEDNISEKEPSYVIALEDLPREKEIIKAYFFTAEKSSKKYKGLYTDFNKILKVENEFRKQSWKIKDFVSKMERNMYKITHYSHSKNGHFDLRRFNKTIS